MCFVFCGAGRSFGREDKAEGGGGKRAGADGSIFSHPLIISGTRCDSSAACTLSHQRRAPKTLNPSPVAISYTVSTLPAVATSAMTAMTTKTACMNARRRGETSATLFVFVLR